MRNRFFNVFALLVFCLSFCVAQADEVVVEQQPSAFLQLSIFPPLQSGVFNGVRKQLTGVQLGVVNYASTANGLQFGILNIAKDLNGVQIGILNIATGKESLPVLPIINASF